MGKMKESFVKGRFFFFFEFPIELLKKIEAFRFVSRFVYILGLFRV